jgi:hypothetical protein
LGNAATAASDDVTSLAPVAFCKFSVIAGAPLTYEKTRLGSNPSTTVATSPIRVSSACVENGFVAELAAPLVAAPEPVAIGAGALAAPAFEAVVEAVLVAGVAATSGAGVASGALLDADADVVVVVDVVASGAIVGSGVGPCPVFGTVCWAATVVLTVVELVLGVGDGEAALDAPEGSVVVAIVELVAVVPLEPPALLPVTVVLVPEVPKPAGAAVATACALPSASA